MLLADLSQSLKENALFKKRAIFRLGTLRIPGTVSTSYLPMVSQNGESERPPEIFLGAPAL